MPRTKEFDEAEVLDQALELFRARGFKHTSFADLTEELGVSRQSLYDTYGDKQALYQTALKRYLDRGLENFRRKLDDPAPVRKLFGQLFDGMIEMQCEGGARGCLMVNSMVELAPHDPATRRAAEEHARGIERLLTDRLEIAQRKGEIDQDKDAAALARYFYHLILGLAVAARALPDKTGLRQTAHLALRALD